ncbi:MAG: cyclic nucleotide-binding domain-containing protein [Acidimicrobiia bacterium]
MARSDPFVSHLAAVPLFSALSNKELQLVAKQAEPVRVPAGKAVVTEGAAGADFFVILGGQARVERHGKKVAELGPGGFFGDLALLDRAPRNASVIAETEMELAKLGQRAFDELLDTVPGFARKLLAGLARRLRVEDAKTV